MNGPKDHPHLTDADATAHALMNEATEWLQHARGISSLLASLIYEAEGVKCKDMASALDAIEAMTHMGLQCATQAHTRMVWDQTPPVNDVLRVV
ncbi:hypothetical protein [Luteibacter yeojuensis]|uniref:Uncharacterized protein n=1 Tax=Luteibacter yeojuensis TaxID=345309 RepID=A0A7X5TRX6_9GAMM|nr:hypothetical protein [Luteibacter yeojuensis]NID17238.1 hypothetical protein [Luteibacter yeojuensis]